LTKQKQGINYISNRKEISVIRRTIDYETRHRHTCMVVSRSNTWGSYFVLKSVSRVFIQVSTVY